MKKNTLLLVTLMLTIVSFGQEITGKWYGDIKTPTGELPLEINISKTENGYSTTMDSPTQKAFGIPITTTTFENSVLIFAIPAGKVSYEGTFNKDNKIVGFFSQRGQKFSLSFDRIKNEKAALIRPQEPKKPYPYYTEDITFENKKDGITLAGTLTLPNKEGNFPVVVLITGSSPQNRDEEILGHKPFLVIADYLTRNGIGVLRYDDRGTASSKGNYETATTLDFSYDAEAAVTYLLSRKEINKKKIGLIGHSEGGVIAPIVASRNKNVSFIALLAGTGLRGDKLLLLQQELVAKDAGAKDEDIKKNKDLNIKLFDAILKSTDDNQLKSNITSIMKQNSKENPNEKFPNDMNEDQYINFILGQYSGVWIESFVKLDPTIYLEKVKCPVLAINGSKDLQVPAKENLEAIKNSLSIGKNKKVTIKELPNMNHLFQETTTGSINEYGKNEQTFSPIALTEILNWLKTQIK
ncbi:alpha/beta hydrolase family protein [Flavobacterium sp.]|uniref:alpha/beta hydrolase family protein n=1 Tax=Flavobacterium sp. TaxID=239 RepID=UPI003752B427